MGVQILNNAFVSLLEYSLWLCHHGLNGIELWEDSSYLLMKWATTQRVNNSSRGRTKGVDLRVRIILHPAS